MGLGQLIPALSSCPLSGCPSKQPPSLSPAFKGALPAGTMWSWAGLEPTLPAPQKVPDPCLSQTELEDIFLDQTSLWLGDGTAPQCVG